VSSSSGIHCTVKSDRDLFQAFAMPSAIASISGALEHIQRETFRVDEDTSKFLFFVVHGLIQD